MLTEDFYIVNLKKQKLKYISKSWETINFLSQEIEKLFY